MNFEPIKLDVVSVKATLAGKTTLKPNSILEEQTIIFRDAEAYFRGLALKIAHRTTASVGKMPQTVFYNPKENDKYGLDSNGFLVEGGNYYLVSHGFGKMEIKERKTIKPKTEKA